MAAMRLDQDGVTRDDMPDGGADHFYHCVLAVRRRTGAAVEVLTPDFLGNTDAIDRVLEASPDVFNHNTETVSYTHLTLPTKA